MNKLNARRVTQMARRKADATYDFAAPYSPTRKETIEKIQGDREAYGLPPLDGLQGFDPVKLVWAQLMTEMECLDTCSYGYSERD